MSLSRIPPLAWVAAAFWTALIIVVFLETHAQSVSTNAQVALTEARALVDQTVDARAWNAGHGGVYVEINEKTQPNPYLDIPDRDIETKQGRRLTLVNPAFMTRQIAQIGAQRHGTKIHLTSLNPIRPENAPSDWERAALELFETGVSEWSGFASEGDRQSFQYIKALPVETACLGCHSRQGYKEGDIRGGLSVDVPVDALNRAGRAHRTVIGLVLAIAWALGLGIVAVVSHSFLQKQASVDELERLSLTDDLTGLLNRRAFFRFGEVQLRLAVRLDRQATIMFFDLDGLKAINDSYGHQEGDKALIAVSELLTATFRASDLIARFGGDEFVVLSFESISDSTETSVSRFRSLCNQYSEQSDEPYRFRVSVGWAPVDPRQPRALETAAAEADKRMYDDKP